jgi:3-hydroxybutyrate dehydrogenase
MVERAQAEFGWVEVLVNNAGILHTGLVEATPVAKWDAVLAVNLSSAFHAIRAVLPSMKTAKSGRIINVASALGLVGAADYAAYATSKHGTMGLTKSVALEVAEQGITVNAICPGYVLTPLVEHELAGAAEAGGISFEAAASAALATGQANGRFVTTEEIGSLAAFLAGPSAASITGAAVPIDGGWTAR